MTKTAIEEVTEELHKWMKRYRYAKVEEIRQKAKRLAQSHPELSERKWSNGWIGRQKKKLGLSKTRFTTFGTQLLLKKWVQKRLASAFGQVVTTPIVREEWKRRFRRYPTKLNLIEFRESSGFKMVRMGPDDLRKIRWVNV